MVNYAGKICPFCRSEFNEDDDVVVCSVCDMPHHKDCWVANQGCSTFGCNGTIKYPDSDDGIEPDKPSFTFCTKCGTRCQSGDLFCHRCGSALVANAANRSSFSAPQNFARVSYPASPSATVPSNTGIPYAGPAQNNVNTTNAQYYSASANNQYSYNTQPVQQTVSSDISMLVGVNTEYYIPKFTVLKNSSNKANWNWCAFLFTPFWLIYRKLYAYGFPLLAVSMIATRFLPAFLSVLTSAASMVFGILGNSIYLDFLEKKQRRWFICPLRKNIHLRRKMAGQILRCSLFLLCCFSFLNLFFT